MRGMKDDRRGAATERCGDGFLFGKNWVMKIHGWTTCHGHLREAQPPPPMAGAHDHDGDGKDQKRGTAFSLVRNHIKLRRLTTFFFFSIFFRPSRKPVRRILLVYV